METATDLTAKKLNTIDIFLVLQKTYRAMLARVEESKRKMGLGDSDFRVLEVLFHRGPLPVNVIGGLIDLTTGSITTAVDRMEAKWLVVRKHHAIDGRIRLVELTPKGRRLIQRACARFAEDMDAAFGGLSRDERRTLVELLNRLSIRDEREADHPDL